MPVRPLMSGRVGRRPGADMRNTHRAAQVADEHLSADLVVAMGRTDARKLTAAGVPAVRLRLLRFFDPTADEPDVANPYHGTRADFEQLFAVIATALPGLHDWVDARLTALPPERVSAPPLPNTGSATRQLYD